MRKIVIAGNWKMFKKASETKTFIENVKKSINTNGAEAIICVPTINLQTAVEAAKGSDIQIAAQNVHFETEGAYTGETSIAMLQEFGIKHAVIGHSERREYFNETDQTLNKKLKALLSTDITPIFCCGESLEIRENGTTDSFVAEQVKNAFDGIDANDATKVVVAYEPIWAIGTGKVATAEQAEETIKNLRGTFASIYKPEIAEKIVIQYGGSVKPDNVKEILSQPNIDGVLVGGASLEEDSYKGLFDYKIWVNQYY